MSGGEWRRDPSGRFEYRWWDGAAYTEWVARHGEQEVDPGPVPDPPSTIEAGFGEPRRQNRWTVGFRLILVIPHAVWLTLVSIAAFFVVVVGWFAALFTARLPTGIERFLRRVLQYHVRVLSYVYLLRGEYPPFSLRDESYPVVVETFPGTLNRAAVFFRLVLAVPALLLASWLGNGLVVAAIVLWVIVLVKGRMPGIAAQAIAATLRYEARAYGYTMLLASTYPQGLYGDGPPAAAPADASTADEQPADLPADLPPEPPRTMRLRLAPGARRLVTVFLVVGILQWVVGNFGGLLGD